MKKGILFLIKSLISILILFFIFKKLDFKLLEGLKSIDNPELLFFSIIISTVIMPFISNNRWKLFLKTQNINESIWSLILINFKSIFLGFLLPSSIGYDAFRIYEIEKRHPSKIGKGGGSVLIERFIGLTSLSFIAFLGSIYCFYSNNIKINILILTFLIFCFSILFFFIIKNKFIFKFASKNIFKIKFAKKIISYLLLFYEGANNFPIKKILLSTVPLILLLQISSTVCCWLIFLVFNIDIPLGVHLAIVPLIQIITIVPISISGMGVRESLFIYFYIQYNVPENTAFIVSLTFYIITIIIPALIGGIIYFSLRNSTKLKN